MMLKPHKQNIKQLLESCIFYPFESQKSLWFESSKRIIMLYQENDMVLRKS